MAQQTKTQLKDKFQDGDKPTGTDFSNLIDSLQQTLAAGTNITLTQNADGSVTISHNGKIGTDTVGSTTLPIYVNAGTPTAITQANLRKGVFGTTAIGATNRPVYIAANGVPTAMTAALPIKYGGTGNTTNTAAKVANAITFTGAVTGSWDGSEAKTVNIPSGGSANGAVRYDISQDLTLGNKLTARGNIGIVGLATTPTDNYSDPIPTLEPGMVVRLMNSTPREITFNLDAFGVGDAAYIVAPGGFEPLPEKVMTSTGEINYWPYYISWTPGTPDPNPTPSSGDHTVAYIYTCVRLQDDSAGVSNMYVTRAPFRQGEIGGSSGSGGY